MSVPFVTASVYAGSNANSNFLERKLTGPEIVEQLAGKWVKGEEFEQSFSDPTGHENASTTYWQGKNASYGRWWVSQDQYCSIWPPNNFEACYDVFLKIDGANHQIIWIDSQENRFEGIIETR